MCPIEPLNPPLNSFQGLRKWLKMLNELLRQIVPVAPLVIYLYPPTGGWEALTAMNPTFLTSEHHYLQN